MFLLIISIKPLIAEEEKYDDNFSEYLLIPESSADVVGLYDPYDGTYLGDLCSVPLIHGASSTAVNAIVGPDGNIYVSDQLQDAVFVFNTTGTYLYEYANSTDGLNNIRGIDFRGTHLFVTSGDDYVAEFDGPHSRLTDFINDGSDPFDIYFLDNGTALLSDIQGTTDNVRYYNSDGSLNIILFSSNFPQQIQKDSISPGDYLNTGFSNDIITDFDISGNIYQTTPFNGGRGIYRLGNGNLLATAGDGVWEIEPGTGALIQQKNTGSGRFIEYYAVGDQPPFTPSNPNPENGETNVSINTNLSWTGGDPNGDPVTYDVYFGDATPLPKVSSNQTSTIYDLGTLSYNTIYYWQIVAWDDTGLSTSGPIWNFETEQLSTLLITTLENNWNFIGIPVNDTVIKNDLIVVYNTNNYTWSQAVGAGIISDFVFGWDRIGQAYNFASLLKPGNGYWLYAYEDCEIWLENISMKPEDPFITNLETGWNIVGLPYDQNVNKTNILVNDIPWDNAVTTGIISDFVFGWNRAGQSYNFADSLLPGYAYWMYAYQPCTLKRAI